MKKTFLFLLLIATSWLSSYAQEGTEAFRPSLRGAIMMANSHVPTANTNGKDVVIIPTWGFDVNYQFHRRWSTGLQAEIKLQSFEVEDGESELQRTDPLALAAVIQYHTLKHWSFYTGPGIELEKSRNLFLFKLGTEYGFEISETFEISLNLVYENKQDIYDAWTFGIAFNKKLWERK